MDLGAGPDPYIDMIWLFIEACCHNFLKSPNHYRRPRPQQETQGVRVEYDSPQAGHGQPLGSQQYTGKCGTCGPHTRENQQNPTNC